MTRGEQKSRTHIVLFECNLFAIDFYLCSTISYFLFFCVCLHVCILFCCDTVVRVCITLSFFFFLHIYLIYAVFIKLVLHYVWQLFCPFYSHFSCMSVGVLYDCVLASMDKKYFVILPDFSLHKKNKFFCVKIIVLFVFMIFVSIILMSFFVYLFLIFISQSISKNPLFGSSSFLLYHHTFYLCCHLLCPSLCLKNTGRLFLII